VCKLEGRFEMSKRFHQSMAIGTLPSREEFFVAWDNLAEDGGLIDDKFVLQTDCHFGKHAFSCEELWRTIELAEHPTFLLILRKLQPTGYALTGKEPDMFVGWCYDILSCFGFEYPQFTFSGKAHTPYQEFSRRIPEWSQL
jgi:hypothetical protein